MCTAAAHYCGITERPGSSGGPMPRLDRRHHARRDPSAEPSSVMRAVTPYAIDGRHYVFTRHSPQGQTEACLIAGVPDGAEAREIIDTTTTCLLPRLRVAQRRCGGDTPGRRPVCIHDARRRWGRQSRHQMPMRKPGEDGFLVIGERRKVPYSVIGACWLCVLC